MKYLAIAVYLLMIGLLITMCIMDPEPLKYRISRELWELQERLNDKRED